MRREKFVGSCLHWMERMWGMFRWVYGLQGGAVVVYPEIFI
jgi:hypothetical protein